MQEVKNYHLSFCYDYTVQSKICTSKKSKIPSSELNLLQN